MVQIVRFIHISNMIIIDRTSNRLATTLRRGRDYELRTTVHNTNRSDSQGRIYSHVQLRIAPNTNSILFFSDASFSRPIGSRGDTGLFTLNMNQRRTFRRFFRWTGVNPANAGLVQFSMGIYAHEMPIIKNWRRLRHPV